LIVPQAQKPTVVVIDDDREVRETVADLLESVGLTADLFGSVQEFINQDVPDRPGCMVLDVRLPGKSGLEFQDDLVRANVRLPIIFISGHADVAMSVRAMKAGAVEFLTKPVRHQELLDAIQSAIGQDRARREKECNAEATRSAFETLTPREREVMALVVAGRPNAQIAAVMRISMATVKMYRGQVMRKMDASSLAELVRMAGDLKPSRPKV
jgi:FixJ family two-component response regulator